MLSAQYCKHFQRHISNFPLTKSIKVHINEIIVWSILLSTAQQLDNMCYNKPFWEYQARVSLVLYRLVVYIRGPQGLNGPFGSWAPIGSHMCCICITSRPTLSLVFYWNRQFIRRVFGSPPPLPSHHVFFQLEYLYTTSQTVCAFLSLENVIIF